MTGASDPTPASAAETFDAALVRGRAEAALPPPVLPPVDPEKAPARTAAGLRRMLSARFAHAVPAAEAALLHRQTVRALERLERRYFRRRVRMAIADFVMTYGFAILGFLVVAALVGLAIVFRDAILAFVGGLLASPPAPPAPVQAPANAAPAAAGAPAPAPAGPVP